MPTQSQRRCRACNRLTLHVKTKPPQTGCLAHVFLSLITLGIWIPIGMLLMLAETFFSFRSKWRCQTCGKAN